MPKPEHGEREDRRLQVWVRFLEENPSPGAPQSSKACRDEVGAPLLTVPPLVTGTTLKMGQEKLFQG